ncbi:MAG TPA: transporter [Sulfurospirillum sp. UBA12182]|jgi:CBS domain containing-hemolysin-like protein|nr:MAG TPA: transporter [Sulfurospirillum sp. UBA12182]
MTLLFVYLALAIGVSFLCSVAESVLLSISMSNINVLKKEKEAAGLLLEKLKKDIDVSIASILVLNTIAHTLGAAGIGAEAVKLFGMEYTFYISAGLTLAILFLSEIIPKTIGAVYYKQLAPYAGYLINFFVFITYPLILVTLFITKKISKGKNVHTFTREELLETTYLSEDEGVIDEMESEVIENLLTLDNNKVRDILTPRSVVFALEKNKTIAEVLDLEGISKFSRIPIYEESIDNIVGVVLSKKIFQVAVSDQTKKMEDLMSSIYFINENIPVSFALDLFIKKKEHMFIVTDSYEQTEGIVTLEDCIETLLGLEIMDELDTIDDMRQFAKSKMKEKKKHKERVQNLEKKKKMEQM